MTTFKIETITYVFLIKFDFQFFFLIILIFQIIPNNLSIELIFINEILATIVISIKLLFSLFALKI